MSGFPTLRRAALRLTLAALLPLLAARADPCPDRGFGFFEQQGYQTRKASVTGFWLLSRFLSANSSALAALEGKPFKESDLLRAKLLLREQLQRSPSAFDSPIGITVMAARVVNCTESGSTKELDIEFPTFTTKVPFTSIQTLEHSRLEKVHPSEALALGPTKTRIRATPLLGYDASQSFLGGGRLEARLPWAGMGLALAGQGSTESLAIHAAFSGYRERDRGWLRQLTWRGTYEHTSLPADPAQLDSSRVTGQFSLVTAPVGRLGAVFRFGTQIEGGHQQTGLDNATLPKDWLAGSGFGDWRSYGGVTLRTGRHSLAASGGLLLGRTGSGQTVDYRKEIVDVAYDGRMLLAPHRPLGVEARFTAGWLQQLGPTPVSERFFGGNVETPFMPGSAWVIRANPVLRGIPAYRLNRTGANQIPGGDQFTVLNLTVAIPAFGYPIIPKEASQDPEVRAAVEGIVSGGADFLVPIYELDDPAQQELFHTRRESFAKTTSDMEERVDALEASIPATLKAAYDACKDKIGDLAADASDISKTTPWRNFLKPDPEERGIPVIVKVCLEDLNGTLKDPALTRLGDELKEHQRVIAEQVGKIDTAKAKRLAAETMAFPAQVVHTVFDEMTVVSASPVAILDAGRIGPATAGQTSARYSVGGGLRLTLASSVSFEIGYAWNVHPRPWEGRGALFMGIRFIDLFGK
ncbi:MAG: hypothetical protein ABI759_02875 [Candidatus Solibacter sp.]